jgi:rod shape-determining protein MreB
MFGTDVGIDLGTATVLIYIRGKGIVLQEPSVVAVSQDTGKVISVGTDAQRMLGRTPGNILAIRPLRDGVISYCDYTEEMIKYFLKKVCKNMMFKPRVMICVPSGITDVEERAIIDAAIRAGASKAYLIEEPVAAAVGAGIDISKPHGNMVVDIGGGTTDIAVISLGEVAVATSIKVAGDKFDESLIKYIRRKHNILVGERTAEEIKKTVGCVYPRETEISMKIKGRCLLTGLPKMIEFTSTESLEAFAEPIADILDAIHSVLERTPPELTGDISTDGIVVTGGGGLLYGFDKLISGRTGIPTRIADDPISCVAIGTGKELEFLSYRMDGVQNIAKRNR